MRRVDVQAVSHLNGIEAAVPIKEDNAHNYLG